MLRKTVDALIADERRKSHHALAERLRKAGEGLSTTPSASLSTSRALGENGSREAILLLEPRIRLDELVLESPVRLQALELIEEHTRSDVLRAHGLEPRHRVLLSGPPGNGKTSFAEAIAEALALPFFVVRYDTLIGSYLGETNTRLRRLFDFIRTTPCILFFDEFDSIGKERGDPHETGEIKRVVAFLLMQIDQLPSYVLVIAATNHSELLDRAVWRRFQLRLSFPTPKPSQLARYLESRMEHWAEKPRITPAKIGNLLGHVSYAEAEEFCTQLRRRYILAMGEASMDDVAKGELAHWAVRIKPVERNAKRSNKTAIAARSKRAQPKTSPRS
jgi:SpoVK/Ycf46/Vps4 family AAA+-type ATPase